MPIYEYKCRDCGDKFEKLVRSGTGGDGIKCPVCSSEDVARQISVCAMIGGGASDLTGSGAAESSCAPTGGG
jgi:putative FmdB family regulatory protein